jgi:hypothetical protein
MLHRSKAGFDRPSEGDGIADPQRTTVVERISTHFQRQNYRDVHRAFGRLCHKLDRVVQLEMAANSNLGHYPHTASEEDKFRKAGSPFQSFVKSPQQYKRIITQWKSDLTLLNPPNHTSSIRAAGVHFAMSP